MNALINTQANTPTRSTYTYAMEDGVVCIIDLLQGKSVTNDAPGVIADLIKARIDLEKHPVIYRDSMSIWDQMLVVNGKFSDFKSLGEEKDREAAKLKVMPQTAIVIPGPEAAYCNVEYCGLVFACVHVNGEAPVTVGCADKRLVRSMSLVLRDKIRVAATAYFDTVFEGKDWAPDYVQGEPFEVSIATGCPVNAKPAAMRM